MLRNWSELVPAGSPAAGALVAGTEFVGLLGSEILAATASGDHGSGLFVPWSPEVDKRYRVLVTALTGGPLALAEDGSGVADGPFEATLSVYEDNLLVSDSITVTGAVGGPLSASSAATLGLSGSASASVRVSASSAVAHGMAATSAGSAAVSAQSAAMLSLAGSSRASVRSERGSLARISMTSRSLRVTIVA